MTRWIWFPMALTPIRASHRSESSNLIYAIRWKRNLEAAQSRASNKDINLFQVRQRARLTFQSLFHCFPGCLCQCGSLLLFPSNLIN